METTITKHVIYLPGNHQEFVRRNKQLNYSGACLTHPGTRDLCSSYSPTSTQVSSSKFPPLSVLAPSPTAPDPRHYVAKSTHVFYHRADPPSHKADIQRTTRGGRVKARTLRFAILQSGYYRIPVRGCCGMRLRLCSLLF